MRFFKATEEQFLLWHLLEDFCRCSEYKLLRVTAVLTASDDGCHALGAHVGGKVVPIDGYLRDPAVHLAPDENYIVDWIRLANMQLLQSGACFGLDVENITYVLESNSSLHERKCGDEDGQATAEYFANQANTSPDSPYRDSVILLFSLGPNPNKPFVRGCSSAAWPYILMPGKYRDEGKYLDGVLRFGNNLLTHELGHFMGLSHTFPPLYEKISSLATAGNPKRLPLTTANLTEMPGLTAADLQTRLDTALEYIATWPYSLEQDKKGNAVVGIPDEYGITDTPVDLGVGLPLVHGDAACTGTHTYTFQRYHPSDLQDMLDANGEQVWWEPKPGAVPTIESTITVNDDVRRNVMGYWYCSNENERFSVDQVKRMHFVLAHLRSELVARTTSVGVCGSLRVPILVKRFLPPWEPVVRTVIGGWQQVVKRFAPHRWHEVVTIIGALPTARVAEATTAPASIAERALAADSDETEDPLLLCYDDPPLQHHTAEPRLRPPAS